MDKRLIRIAKHYGYEAQSRQLIEEMAELTQALNKLWRAGHVHLNGSYEGYEQCESIEICRTDVIGEMADVKICLEQLAYFIDVAPEEIQQDMEIKINRQLERMEREENEKHD